MIDVVKRKINMTDELGEPKDIKIESLKRRELIAEDNNKYLNYIDGINSNQDNIKIEFIVNGNKAKFFEDLKDELKKTNITKNTFTEIADNFIDYLGILEDILLNDANNLKDISGANIIEEIKERFITDIDDICKYIPILGDAEEVIGLKDEDGLTIDNDSIDNEVIQKDIVEIMEGGQEAFQRREKIYNEWNSN